jgi:hypothetical protein
VLLGPGIKPGPPAWQAAAQAAQPSTTTFERKRFQCHEKMFQNIIVRIFGFFSRCCIH